MSWNNAPVQVIRHVSFEGVGMIGEELARAGWSFDYLDPPRQSVSAAREARLLVVMGGPISVNDVDRFPYLADEVEVIRHRIEHGLPTLGICLGAQLIARALGAAVAPMASPEIGWRPLTLTDVGATSPLRHLAGPVLHWHGEMFELPAGCPSLASTPACANQAFMVEHHTLALQFHIEVGPGDLEHWLVGHVHELDHHDISVPNLRDDTRSYSRTAIAEGRQLLSTWLSVLRIDGGSRSREATPMRP